MKFSLSILRPFLSIGGYYLIRVVDAIMGSGKSSAAITYMNEHPDTKFIYITPFLDEVRRVTDSCRQIHMYEPLRKNEHHGSKVLHTMDLVHAGRCIATTHSAFLHYTPDLLREIHDQRYVLIVDEDVNTLERVEVTSGDIDILSDSGRISKDENNSYNLVLDNYSGGRMEDLMYIFRSHDVKYVQGDKRNKDQYLIWSLPPEFITSFQDVFILTYMFNGQTLKKMFDIYGLPYQYCHVTRDDSGTYRLSDTERYIPSYLAELKQKIHIIEDGDRLNAVGEPVNALSASWFKSQRNREAVEQLQKNLSNFFNKRCRDVLPSDKMWSTFEKQRKALTGKGYSRGFLSFNARATNNYRYKTHLAYCVNVYQHASHSIYYASCGEPTTPEENDAYAISTMVQWVWRSAIRDGKDIWLYVPSSRMRKLFTSWLDQVAEEVNR